MPPLHLGTVRSNRLGQPPVREGHEGPRHCSRCALRPIDDVLRRQWGRWPTHEAQAETPSPDARLHASRIASWRISEAGTREARHGRTPAVRSGHRRRALYPRADTMDFGVELRESRELRESVLGGWGVEQRSEAVNGGRALAAHLEASAVPSASSARADATVLGACPRETTPAR